jgi:hypothetical protein
MYLFHPQTLVENSKDYSKSSFQNKNKSKKSKFSVNLLLLYLKRWCLCLYHVYKVSV